MLLDGVLGVLATLLAAGVDGAFWLETGGEIERLRFCGEVDAGSIWPLPAPAAARNF